MSSGGSSPALDRWAHNWVQLYKAKDINARLQHTDRNLQFSSSYIQCRKAGKKNEGNSHAFFSILLFFCFLGFFFLHFWGHFFYLSPEKLYVSNFLFYKSQPLIGQFIFPVQEYTTEHVCRRSCYLKTVSWNHCSEVLLWHSGGRGLGGIANTLMTSRPSLSASNSPVCTSAWPNKHAP